MMMKKKVIVLLVIFALMYSGCSQIQVDDIHNNPNITPSFSTNRLFEFFDDKKIFFLFSYKDNLLQIDDVKGNISKDALKKLLENNDIEGHNFKDCIAVMKNNQFSTCSKYIDNKSIFAMKYIDPINTVESAVAVVASVPIAILSTLVGEDNNLENTYNRAKDHAIIKIADKKLVDKIGMTISYLFITRIDNSLTDIYNLESLIKTYNFLNKNNQLNNELVKLYRKDGTFNSYLKSYIITNSEKDYLSARNVAVTSKQKILLQNVEQKITIAKTKEKENEAVVLAIAGGILYGGYKLISGFFKSISSGVHAVGGYNYVSDSNPVKNNKQLAEKKNYIDGDGRIFRNGKEVAQINYYYGEWRINCATWATRVSGDTNYHEYNNKKEVIQTALQWCKP